MFVPRPRVYRSSELVSDAVAANALRLLAIMQTARHSAMPFAAQPPSKTEVLASDIVHTYFEQEAAKLRIPTDTEGRGEA